MKDFLQNRPRVNAPHRGTAEFTAAASQPTPLFDAAMLGTAHPGGGGHEPSVEAIKEGDRVTKLIVTCRCGEKIEILCAYAPGQR
ncbi:MAG TPA: hypothetical protein VK178_00090 [Opitutaceae bacterium]|nr:hypothetical protein [Opitutaceae bacterium]